MLCQPFSQGSRYAATRAELRNRFAVRRDGRCRLVNITGVGTPSGAYWRNRERATGYASAAAGLLRGGTFHFDAVIGGA